MNNRDTSYIGVLGLPPEAHDHAVYVQMATLTSLSHLVNKNTRCALTLLMDSN